MNILFCQHNSICEPGIIRALNTLQHNIRFTDFSFSNPDTDTNYAAHLSSLLSSEQFHIVFSINFIPLISEVCSKHSIPYFCWIVDSPVLQLYSDTLLNTCNYVFVFDYTLYSEFCGKNPDHIFYFPLGCDLELYDSIKPTNDDQKKYACDVSFVGSLYTEKCPYNSVEDKFPDYIKGYFRGILNAQQHIYGYNFLTDIIPPDLMVHLDHLINITPAPGYHIDKQTLIGSLLLTPKCTELERTYLLNLIASRFDIDLYTNSDTANLTQVNVKGAASSLNVMPLVFKTSKINLNLTAKGICSGASLRIFDILGCGGFLISNYQSELTTLFEIDKEIVLFESEADLLDKISYYLTHDDERKAIARCGYEKVKKEFSYQMRLTEMLSVYDTI